MNTNRYREITNKDWLRVGLILLSFIAVITIFSILLLPEYRQLWLLTVAGSVILLVVWHTKNFAYRCSECGEVFEISPAVNALSPKGINKK